MATVSPLVKGLAFLGTHGAKEAFLAILREMFADPKFMEESYLYRSPVSENCVGNDEGGGPETKIRIYKAYPQEILSYPCVIITMGAFDFDQKYMGEETGEMSDARDPSTGYLLGRTFGSYYTMPVQLTVFSRNSPNDRDRIIDLLLIMLQMVKRPLAFKYGLSYLQAPVGGDEQQADPRDGSIVFKKTITLLCQTDWNWFLSQDEAELVKAILLKVYMAAPPLVGDTLYAEKR